MEKLVVGFVFVVAVILAFVAPRAMTLMPGVCALLFCIYFFVNSKGAILPKLSEFLTVFTMVFMAAVSSLWAYNPDFAIERAWKIAAVVIPGVFFLPVCRRMNIGRSFVPVVILSAVYSIICLLILFEYHSGFFVYKLMMGLEQSEEVGISRYNRSLVILSIFYFPLIHMILNLDIRRVFVWLVGGIVTLALLAALYPAESQSAQLCFVLGLLFYVLFPAGRKWAWFGFGGFVVVLAFASPWFVGFLGHFINADMDTDSFLYRASAPHRMEVWSFVVSEIFKHPFIGQGIEIVRFIRSEEIMPLMNAHTVLHPHNVVLQIWVEFGVLGIVIASVIFAGILRSAYKACVPSRKLYVSVIVSVMSVSSMGYGFWQGWWLGFMLFIAGVCIVAGKYSSESGKLAEEGV